MFVPNLSAKLEYVWTDYANAQAVFWPLGTDGLFRAEGDVRPRVFWLNALPPKPVA
jgi:hypothetical protein